MDKYIGKFLTPDKIKYYFLTDILDAKADDNRKCYITGFDLKRTVSSVNYFDGFAARTNYMDMWWEEDEINKIRQLSKILIKKALR